MSKNYSFMKKSAKFFEGEEQELEKFQEESVDATLVTIAKALRQTYITERRSYIASHQGRIDNSYGTGKTMAQWDGGQTASGKRSNVWLKLAQFVVQRQLDPVRHIRSVFIVHVGNYPPMPNMMFCIPYNKHELDKDDRQTIEIEFDNYKRSVSYVASLHVKNRLVDLTRVLRNAISSPTVQAKDIYRYCVAVESGQLDLAANYLYNAAMDYLYRRESYDAVLGKYLPENFKAYAFQLRDAANKEE